MSLCCLDLLLDATLYSLLRSPNTLWPSTPSCTRTNPIIYPSFTLIFLEKKGSNWTGHDKSRCTSPLPPAWRFQRPYWPQRDVLLIWSDLCICSHVFVCHECNGLPKHVSQGENCDAIDASPHRHHHSWHWSSQEAHLWTWKHKTKLTTQLHMLVSSW